MKTRKAKKKKDTEKPIWTNDKTTIPLVYFAGKVYKNCYRTRLLNNHRVMSDPLKLYEIDGREIRYSGPLALSCDHGCWHNYPHGLLKTDTDLVGFNCESGFLGEEEGEGFDPNSIGQICSKQIESSDFIIAYINTLDCYGTISEICMASAYNKPIFLFIDLPLWRESKDKYIIKNDKIKLNKQYDDLWFIKNLPYVTAYKGFPDFNKIPKYFFKKQQTYKEKYHDYLKSEEWQLLRIAKLKEVENKCQLCNSEHRLHVHHKTYENIFHEELKDLVVLCQKCHSKFHDKTS